MSPPTSCTDLEIDRSIMAGTLLAHPEPGEDIIISGLSGSYPNSLTVHDFRDNIFNKVDLVSEDNRLWNIKNPEIPKRGGRILDIEKFDAAFFGVHYKQVHTMDPMGRILLEKTFEAVVDAGMNPAELKGTRTGVFIGACFSDNEKTWFYEKPQPNGFAITGCIRSMLANRISYWLGVDGPSYTVDTACSSSFYALEHAYRAIRTGQCDMAIVGASNLCLHPYVTLHLARLGVLSMDGKCKCFDDAADGYTRAEAVVVAFLQKSKDARRIYCQLIHAKTNCDGYKEQGITYPSAVMQTNLLKEFYAECQVNPLDISFVEAHGTGTQVGDPEELCAIENVFCPKERKSTLLIGSVKSNIGHAEPASGLCSLSKVILAMEAGQLIPNINYTTSRKEIKPLVEGRIQVVTDKMKWNAGYAAISNFGFGGSNCHVLLKSCTKEKVNQGVPNDDIPRLVYLSGRTEEAINTVLDYLAAGSLDAEFIGLVHEVFKFDIPAHIYRGYAVLTKEGIVSRELGYHSYENKPLWFVFSGLAGQWLGMANDLMKIPVFTETIEKCHKILSQRDINITDLITKSDPFIFVKQTNAFVAITSMHIALLELLKYIELKPNGIVGYSIGEIACAYYDGCLTLEQALLCSYYLGQASDHCKNAAGTMISVDAAQNQIQELLVYGLEIACNNSERNCIVSGPTAIIEEFIMKLKQQNISFVDLNTSLAYHSSHVNEIASLALKHLKPIVPNPQERSVTWISTLSTDENSNKSSSMCSAEFLSSVVVKPIKFEEYYSGVPNNAIALEISPHGILQKVLKRSVFDDSINISILNKNSNGAGTLMTALGKIYKAGYNSRIEKLYPKISFPVSRGTSMLSPLIRWDHSQDWFVTKFEVLDKIESGERSVTIKLNDDEHEFIAGHLIDGRILYPETGYLVLVWETLGMVLGQDYTSLPVVFENVKFHRATSMQKETRVVLIVMVQKVSGNFEVIEGGIAIATGRVYVPEDINNEILDLPLPVLQKKDYFVPLNSRDIYKELRLRGYNYSGLFRGLKSCDTTATIGQVCWKGNWTAFLNTVLQMQILQEDTRSLFVATSIEKLTINTLKQNQIIEGLTEDGTIPAYVYRHLKTFVCGGIEIRGVNASTIARKKNLEEPVLETYKFIPNIIEQTNLSLVQSVRTLLHMVLENVQTLKVKTVEVLEDNIPEDAKLISPIIVEAFADLPLKQPDVNVLSTNQIKISGATVSDKKLISENNCIIVIGANILRREQVLQAALNAIIKGGYIIARESHDINLSEVDLTKVSVIADHKLQSERLILLSKLRDSKAKSFIDVTDVDNKFEWLPILQKTLKTDPSPCIYSQADEFSGIIGFANCIRREPGTENVSCVFIIDKDAPKFDPNDEFYASQLKKCQAMNILKNGQWGTYRHLLLEENKTIDVEHAYVDVTVRGDVSSLKWLEGSLSRNAELDCKHVLVHVYYSAMNFVDIMTATDRIAPEIVSKGRFEQDCVQGLEFAGRLSNGRRVIGMVPHLSMATLVAADPQLMWDVPGDWTLEEAATIPVVYGTVLYAFVLQGKIQPGMSVLIHSGTGGVGQAAINIAFHYGCMVYTTVGTHEKREFIRKHWPQIKDNQIGNSRDTSFEQMIMTETNGKGVDMVLNSLAEEKLQASVRCLAHGGKFLEIGKLDLSEDNPLPLNTFVKETSFHRIMLDTIFKATNSIKQKFNNLINKSIKNGAIKPLHRCVFRENEVEEMFRFMATGKHIGKVLLKIRNEEPQNLIEPPLRLVKAIPRFYSSGDGSYIIIGGLGGFGLELVDWLIIRGVRKLVLTSRKGIRTGYQAMRIRIWKSYGVELIIATDDVTTYDGCQTIIEQALQLGPVEAIFNLAVVLKDAIFANQTLQDFEIPFGAKAVATKNFDELSRELCPDLKQFVIFSSVVCGRGNAGQTNYGIANAVLERICEKRHEDGLPALAVEWGAIGDVGLLTELEDEHKDLIVTGTRQQRITSCLAALNQFLCQKQPICTSLVVADKRTDDGAAANVVDAVVNILGIRDIKTVSMHSSLAELGMDSIMAVEIKHNLEREFKVFLTLQDIRSMTFARLKEIASELEITQNEKTENIQETVNVSEMGMHFIMRAIADEENTRKPVVVLPSKATASTKERVILIPGIEGMASVLEILAEHLTAQAIVLQPGYSNRANTIQEMAANLLDRTLENLPDLQTDGFTIASYSYGASIAIELAALLEARGAVGRLVFVDGAPEMLQLTAGKQIKSDQEDLQNRLLSIIVNHVVSGDIANQLSNVLINCPTWESKLDTLFKYSPKHLETSVAHYRTVCDGVYLRLKAILNYKSTVGKLKSSFKLIKARDHSITMDAEDFGLSEYSIYPVEVVYVDGNHVLITKNPETSREINKVMMKELNAKKEYDVSKIDGLQKEF